MDRTYRKVLTQLPEGSQSLDDAYGAVQKTITEFRKYVNVSAGNFVPRSTKYSAEVVITSMSLAHM
jgi:hypothetical protein